MTAPSLFSWLTEHASWAEAGGWAAVGGGTDNGVAALALSSYGEQLYAGGYFTGVTNGASRVAASHVAAWTVASNSWQPLGAGVNSNVHALAVSYCTLYAGGEFWTAGGGPAGGIAAWDGTCWQAIGSGVSGTAEAIALSTGSIYVGAFATAGGTPVNGLARWKR